MGSEVYQGLVCLVWGERILEYKNRDHQLFNTIHFKNLRGDIFGGLTAAIVSLPMALAFGVASGAGPTAGLYGAVLVGFFASLFGGTATLISEPTGPMTVVMTAVISTMIASDPEHGLAMAFTVVIFAGVFQIILGALKLGKYITIMPYSVISGFMSGIGIVLVILQLPSILGHLPPPGGVVGTLKELPALWASLQPQEMFLGVLTLSILFFLPKASHRYVPPQLVALIVGTTAPFILLQDYEIRKIGEISMSLPTLQWPTFTADQFTTIVLNAMVLGTLGCIDSLLTSVISDSLTRQEHDSNRELIGQGIGNIVSGLFGGLPGAGATMGTIVNIQSGAQTALSGLVRAVLLLCLLFGAASFTQHIPLAVLAGIAVKVGLSILDWSFVRRTHKVSWQATAIMYSVMALTVFFDLIVAVGLGFFIANVITIERLSRYQTERIKTISDVSDEIPLTKEEKQYISEGKGKVLLMYLSGPMIFGVAKAIFREQIKIQRYRSIVLDLSDVPLLDTTVSLAIENSIRDALARQRKVFIVKPRAQVKKTLERLGIFELIPCTQLCDSRASALAKAVGKIN